MTNCHGQHVSSLEAGSFFVSETAYRPGLALSQHRHSTSSLHCVLAGEYDEETTGHRVTIGRGQSLFKPPGLLHWNRIGDLGSMAVRIEFRPERLDAFEGSYPTSLMPTENPMIYELARRMLFEIRGSDPVAPMVVEGLCLEILSLLLRDSLRVESQNADNRVSECAEFIRSKFRESFTLSDISESLGVNRTQLAQEFRRVHNCTMGDYLRQVRVGHVMEQLEATDRALVKIAQSAGFSDQSHCTRTFKRLVGVTPAAWRTSRSR